MKTTFYGRTFAAVAILTLAACGLFRNGPAATVEKFDRLVEKGEITDASKLLSVTVTAQFGEKIKAALAEQTKEMQGKKGIKSITVRSETVTGEMAEVVTEITFGNGTTRVDKTKLVRENGEWRLTGDK